VSQAQIEHFYTRVQSEPALMQELMSNFTTPEEFTARVVAKGKDMGYDFTYAEAEAWIEQQRNVDDSGELSDMQLEAVSGGKTARQAIRSGANEIGMGHNGPVDTGVKYAGAKINEFFSGW